MTIQKRNRPRLIVSDKVRAINAVYRALAPLSQEERMAAPQFILADEPFLQSDADACATDPRQTTLSL